MRFLCLHGMGTNSTIFELQTAKIRQALGPEHEFIFVDGTVPWLPAPGLENMGTHGQEFLRYIVEEDMTTFQNFYTNLQAFVLREGPFEGIFGFSEGGGLAVSLVAEQLKNPCSVFSFQCAVLFSAGPAIDLLTLEGVPAALDVTKRERISIPTAHIWDPDDNVHPGFGTMARGLFQNSTVEEVTHPLGHEIPGCTGTLGMPETVRAIRRTIERATLA